MFKVASLILVFSSLNIYAETITWNHVVKNIKETNYMLDENRIKLSQAREYTNYAKMSLYPKLNIFKVINIFSPSGGIVGLLEDLVPFLIPSNWSRVKESKLLEQAMKYSYQTLLGNEIQLSKSLYQTIINDENLLFQLKENNKLVVELYELASARSEFGLDEYMVKNHLNSLMIQNQEDIKLLSQNILEEKYRLNFIMGIDTKKDFTLTQITEDMVPYSNEDNLTEAILSSPELKSFDQLIEVSDEIKKEITFSFMGGSTIAKAFDGGVFADIPIDGALGPSTPAQIRISAAGKELLIKQRAASVSLMKMQWELVTSAIENLISQKLTSMKLFNFSKERILFLKDQMYLGRSVNLAEFTDAIQSLSKATAYMYLTESQLKQNFTKLERMMWIGDFKLE